jgi:hypothetical protein
MSDAIVADPGDWQDDALCRVVRVNFFPERHEFEAVRLAKTVCAECPVQVACLAYALANHEQHGIWGGLSERQRRQIRVKGGSMRPALARATRTAQQKPLEPEPEPADFRVWPLATWRPSAGDQ